MSETTSILEELVTGFTLLRAQVPEGVKATEDFLLEYLDLRAGTLGTLICVMKPSWLLLKEVLSVDLCTHYAMQESYKDAHIEYTGMILSTIAAQVLIRTYRNTYVRTDTYRDTSLRFATNIKDMLIEYRRMPHDKFY
jgi:hypothetical protein